MNKELKIGLAALLVAVVALGVGFFRGGETVTNTTIEKVIRETVGAMPGNELQGPVFTVGGISTYYKRVSMSASNTPCSIRNTDFGTSSIESVSFKQTSGASTAIRWTISTSTTQTATGTPLLAGFTVGATEKVRASVGGSLSNASFAANVASTTQDGLLFRNDWVNVNISGVAGLTTSQIEGECSFILREL